MFYFKYFALICIICNSDYVYARQKTSEIMFKFKKFLRDWQPNEEHVKSAAASGLFVEFVTELLEVVTTSLTDTLLKEYVNTLGNTVKHLNYDSAKTLGKHIEDLASDDIHIIKYTLIEWWMELNKNMTSRVEFLEAMNYVYTLHQAGKFQEYIQQLKDYAAGDKIDMEFETAKLVREHINYPITKLSTKELDDLREKLQNAVKEYNEYRNQNAKQTIFPWPERRTTLKTRRDGSLWQPFRIR